MNYKVTVEVTCIVSVEGEDERAAEENAFSKIETSLKAAGIEAGDMNVTDTQEIVTP